MILGNWLPSFGYRYRSVSIRSARELGIRHAKLVEGRWDRVWVKCFEVCFRGRSTVLWVVKPKADRRRFRLSEGREPR